jgi:hypothetical protein
VSATLVEDRRHRRWGPGWCHANRGGRPTRTQETEPDSRAGNESLRRAAYGFKRSAQQGAQPIGRRVEVEGLAVGCSAHGRRGRGRLEVRVPRGPALPYVIDIGGRWYSRSCPAAMRYITGRNAASQGWDPRERQRRNRSNSAPRHQSIPPRATRPTVHRTPQGTCGDQRLACSGTGGSARGSVWISSPR